MTTAVLQHNKQFTTGEVLEFVKDARAFGKLVARSRYSRRLSVLRPELRKVDAFYLMGIDYLNQHRGELISQQELLEFIDRTAKIVGACPEGVNYIKRGLERLAKGPIPGRLVIRLAERVRNGKRASDPSNDPKAK